MAENPLSEMAGESFRGIWNLIKALVLAVVALIVLGGGGAYWAYSYGHAAGEKLGRAEAACEAKKGILKDGQCIQTVVIP